MLFNRDKIILDLCGGSGAWSKYYKNAGYDVRVITTPEQDVTDYIPSENVWGILSAPPCTMFSLARTKARLPRNLIEGMIPVNACIRIAVTSKPKFFALENPIGLLSKFLGKWKYDFSYNRKY
ncbi:MAG: DNA cytosine methyltransferase [Deltaproteobacteria bacterium]|nr:DNA cytosine methyltransferase [Deltaproteobacteria bacterium]